MEITGKYFLYLSKFYTEMCPSCSSCDIFLISPTIFRNFFMCLLTFCTLKKDSECRKICGAGLTCDISLKTTFLKFKFDMYLLRYTAKCLISIISPFHNNKEFSGLAKPHF